MTYLPQIVAYVGWCLPGTIIIMKNFFMSIPVELLEAARIDGSGEVKTMTKIALPLMKSSILTCVVFNFLFCMGRAHVGTIINGCKFQRYSDYCWIVEFPRNLRNELAVVVCSDHHDPNAIICIVCIHTKVFCCRINQWWFKRIRCMDILQFDNRKSYLRPLFGNMVKIEKSW